MPVVPGTSLDTVLITAQYLQDDGVPCTGTVTFSADPNLVLVDSAGNQIVFPTTHVAVLNPTNGTIAINIPATIDPNLTPSGWTWQVVERITNFRGRSYSMQIPYNQPGGTLDLADVVPVVPLPGVVSYLLSSARGAPGGVAPLDGAGLVPTIHLPAGSGGGAPSTADFLVGTTQPGLSAEIVVGTSPGGELGGSWSAPTVDATHSGTSHTKPLYDAKGDILVASANDTPARVPVGANGQVLTADSAAGTGVTWTTPSGGPGGGAPTDATYLTATANGTLTAEVVVGPTPGGDLAGTSTTWANPRVTDTHAGSAHSSLIGKVLLDAKGDIIVATANDTPARLGVGTTNQVLTADSATATGLKWADPVFGAPVAATYLTTTAEPGLSAETVVGTAPGGELAGATSTWASPKVAPTHAGTAHTDLISRNALTAGVRPYFGRELRRWYADLANAHAQQVNVLVVGDSVAAGANADSPPAGYTGYFGPGRYIETFLRRMQQAHGTGRGTPYMPTRYNLAAVNGMNWFHTTPNSSLVGGTDGGLGRWVLGIGANTGNYIETVQECDSFQIFYTTGFIGGMGTFVVKVDGDTVGTVAINQTSATWGTIWDSRTAGVTIAPGKHTIRIQTTVTGTVPIEGGIFYNGDYGTGVHVYDASHGGVTSGYFADATRPEWGKSVTPVAPSLVIYNMGLNDLTGATPTSTFKSNIHTALNTVQSNTTIDPSELILIPHAHSNSAAGSPTEAAWLPYRQAMYEVASERNAAVMDTYHLFGYAKVAADSANLFTPTTGTPDEIHLNERGHRALGNLLADYLMGSGPSDRGGVHRILPATADVRTPPTGFGDFHLFPLANRLTPTVRPPVGQPITTGIPFTKAWVSNQPGTDATDALNWSGVGGPHASTGTVATAGPDVGSYGRAIDYTAAGANTGASQGDADLIWHRGLSSLSPGAGFFFTASIVAAGATAFSASRWFIGLTAGTPANTVIANDPGNNHIGFTFNSGFVWVFSTAAATARTQTATTMPVTTDDPMEFFIYNPAGSATVYWEIRNVGALPKSVAGSKTTNLPDVNQLLRRAWAVQTTEAAAKTMKVYRLYCESDR